jgi:hypothetical protein
MHLMQLALGMEMGRIGDPLLEASIQFIVDGDCIWGVQVGRHSQELLRAVCRGVVPGMVRRRVGGPLGENASAAFRRGVGAFRCISAAGGLSRGCDSAGRTLPGWA